MGDEPLPDPEPSPLPLPLPLLFCGVLLFPEDVLVPDASAGTATAAEFVLAELVLVACTLLLLFKFGLALLMLPALAGLLVDAGLLAVAGTFAEARLLAPAERLAEAEVPAMAGLLMAAGLLVDGAGLAAATENPELCDANELVEAFALPDELGATGSTEEDDDTEAELEALDDRLGVEARLPGFAATEAELGELVDTESGAVVLEVDKPEVVGVSELLVGS